MIFLNSLEQRIAPLLVLNDEKIEEINKPFKLTIRATKGLEKNDRIIFEEKEYVVAGVEEINGQDLAVEIYAEESITELSGNLILDKRPTSLLAALQAITENTRWNIGSYPATTGKSLSFFRINSLEALYQTLEAYGLEMETEYDFGSPISRTLHLRNRVGESRGRRTTLHTDAVEVKRIVHDDDVVTRLYGYGKGESLESGGYGRRLDISTVNAGLEYIEDNNARLAYGIGADRLHRDAVLIYEDIVDPNELKAAMIADFEILKTPKVTYDGTMADLGLFDDKLGDDITILDEVLGIAVKGRILKLAKTNDKKQVTIGSLLPSFRSEIDRIKDIENRIRDFDVIRNAVVNLDNVDYLNGVIDRINTELNATTGYASLIPGRGIVIPNAPDEASATQVIELGGGYWRIANSKDAFGNWEYRTIADGRGIIATEIIAGILKGGQVEFNLEAGTFIIGDPANPSLFWDGSNLKIDGDSIELTGTNAISLRVASEVTEQLSDPAIQEQFKGDPGIQGPPGADGQPTYTWVKYADTPTSGMDDYPDGKKYIGLAFNKTTPTESTSYSAYQWSLMPQNIEIGERNLLRNSGVEVSNGNYNIASYDFTDEIKVGEEVTLTIWGELASTKSEFRAYNSGGSVAVATLTDNGDGTYSSTFKWVIGSSTNTYLNVYAFTNAQTGISTISKIKLEKGNIATDWTPAPEDVQGQIDTILSVTTDHTTEINLSKDSITQLASSTETTIGTLSTEINALSTQMKVFDEGVNIDISAIRSRVTATEEDVDIYKSTVAINNDDQMNPQIVMSRADKPKQLAMNLEKGLTMTDNGVVTLEASDQQVFTTRLVVLQSINFGNHVAEKYGEEFTIFNPVGG